ncbi:MAG: TIGR02996 domain-containing protein [Gemmataceae bacterium]|nr:TIGR02996 domain-containing protein [Gemmataceae bacterium]
MARAAALPAPRAELVGLLCAARMAPLEDMPRLVAADWLEEHGDEADLARAAFIRAQVKRSRKQKFGQRTQDFSAEERKLLKKHRAAWEGGLGPLAEEGTIGYVRGLIDFRCSTDALLKKANGPHLRSEAAAWLDELVLEGCTLASLKKVLATPVVPWLGGLVAPSCGLGPEACRAIASCEGLSGVQTLDLNYNNIENEGAAALARSPHLGGVSHLDLWISRIGSDGAKALAESRTLGHPVWLNLGGNSIGEAGIRALAGSAFLENARRLLLWGNGLGSLGVAALLKSPTLGPVEELYLNDNRLGLRGAKALASWPGLSRVQTLSLWGNRFEGRGGAALAEAPFDELRMLLLQGNGIGDEAAIALANNPRLRKLEQLDLNGNDLTDATARAILDSASLPRLKNLSISGNDLSTRMMTALGERYTLSVSDEVP